MTIIIDAGFETPDKNLEWSDVPMEIKKQEADIILGLMLDYDIDHGGLDDDQMQLLNRTLTSFPSLASKEWVKDWVKGLK